MKYLINVTGHEENSYYGFESDLSLSELQEELNRLKKHKKLVGAFHGYDLDVSLSLNGVTILTLEDFWLDSLDGGKRIC